MNSTTTPPSAPSPRLGLAIASLVVGILGLLSSVFVVGALFGLAGLILGLVHLSRRQGRNGMAWAGIGLSVTGIALSVLVAVLAWKVMASPEFKKAMENAIQARGNSGSTGFEKWEGVLAPDITATTLDGKTIRLGELKGKRVVLDFWATWCPPCVMEIPHFIKLRNEVSDDELVIVGISNEDTATLRPFVKKKEVNYTIATSKNLPSPYEDVSAIPTTFFIDRKGVIQAVFVGYHDFDDLKAHALAKDFEGEPKPTTGNP